MGRLKSIPIHPLLFVLFPVLFLLSVNIGEITVNQIWQPLIFSLTVAILVWALTDFIIQNRKISAVITSLLLLMFFSYAPVDRIFIWVHIPAAYYILLMFGLAFAVTVLLLKSKIEIIKITLILNVVSVALLIYPSFIVGYYETKRVNEIKLSDLSFLSKTKTQESKKPDIYYIIPDSYASNSALKDYFNFDNSEFTNYLKSKGFYIADESRANYLLTTPSLASSLNMSYLDDIVKKMGIKSKDATPLIKWTEDNQVALYLKSKGYKYYHFGPALLPTSFNKNADFNYIQAEPNQIGISPLTELLLEQTVLSYIVMSADCSSAYSFLCTGSLNSRRSHYSYQLTEITKVGDSMDMEGPKFVFYHSLLTHVPRVFQDDGKYMPLSVERSRSWDENYINQLKFTNKVLKQLIETILNNSKNPPIIILQSDEGPYPERFRKDTNNFEWRGATKDELKEKFGILNAYYLPGIETKALYQEVTPVNTFRIIFNEYFKEKLPLLEDISYAQTKYHSFYNLINITNLMK